MNAAPYYQDEQVTLWHGDALRFLLDAPAELSEAAVISDPPYGIAYNSGASRKPGNARSIKGDKTTALRDFLVTWLADDQPALIFGSPRIPKPLGTRGVLVWDKGGALGMGDLSPPWKFDHEEIYVLGRGFSGRRDTGSVLRFAPVQSTGRLHPNEKPVELMRALIAKTGDRTVLDPFSGSGSTLVAAKSLGRRAIGVELDEAYCEKTAKRLEQGVLDFPMAGTDRPVPRQIDALDFGEATA
jgi:site-specific DNA-methyltransferase (adenine-specific)